MNPLQQQQHTDQAPLPKFSHVQRTWDQQGHCFVARILPGEYYVADNGDAITTVLGSCVSACVRDPQLGLGGMNHFMLPGDGDTAGRQTIPGLITRYGDVAMEHLIDDILELGGQRARLEFKLFGGGRIVDNMADVGKRNIDFVHRFLDSQGLVVTSEDLGQIYPRKVVYFPRSGRVLVRKLRALHNNIVAEEEMQYQTRLSHQPAPGGGDDASERRG